MIPIILDTDIGDDIDDSWALVMLLKMPRLDCRLITTTYGYPDFRTRLLAKYLTVAGRSDIPIGRGTGPDMPNRGENLKAWDDFQLDQYKGTVKADGVDALIQTIHSSKIPVTLIANGPLNTISDALIRDPSIAAKTHFVAMQGSLRMGYRGEPKQVAEYNVQRCIPEAQRVFSAPWKSAAITPLDTCGNIDLAGERYQQIRDSNDPLVRALIESEIVWRKADPSTWSSSSILFDCVSLYMADAERRSLLNFENLKMAVDDAGYTIESSSGQPMDIATTWTSADDFRELLVEILLNRT